jgi:hypothetical protein
LFSLSSTVFALVVVWFGLKGLSARYSHLSRMSSKKPPTGRTSAQSQRSMSSLSSLSSISSLRYPAGVSRRSMRSTSSLKSDSSFSSCTGIPEYTPKGRHFKSCMKGAPPFRPAHSLFDLGVESSPSRRCTPDSTEPALDGRLTGFTTTPELSRSSSLRSLLSQIDSERPSSRLSGRDSALSATLSRVRSAGSEDIEIYRTKSADSQALSRTSSAEEPLARTLSNCSAVSRTRSGGSVSSSASAKIAALEQAALDEDLM